MADRDLRLPWRRRTWALIACGLCLGLLWLLSRSPERVEAWYAAGPGSAAALALARVTGLLPVSLAEFFVLGFALWLAFSLVRLLHFWRRRQRRGRVHEPVLDMAAQLLLMVGLGAVLFYFTWGLNYARPDWVTRQGWAACAVPGPANQSDLDDLESLADAMVSATNDAYREVNRQDDLGRPSALPSSSAELDRSLEDAYRRVAQELGLPASFGASYGRAKPVLASLLLSHIGIAGFYFPLTGEANYNRLMPASEIPLSIAHEKAHQRGVSGEDAANFFGFLAATHSEDPYARYSGYLFAQRQLLHALLDRDADRAMALVGRRLPGVQRDVDAANAYWRRYEGRARDLQTRFNDSYLKFNGVTSGVKSYNESVRLLLIYARVRQGRCGSAPRIGEP